MCRAAQQRCDMKLEVHQGPPFHSATFVGVGSVAAVLLLLSTSLRGMPDAPTTDFIVRPRSEHKLPQTGAFRASYNCKFGVFASDNLSGVGRQLAPPAASFPVAQKRYAKAVRGDNAETKIFHGTLTSTVGGAPWMESSRMAKITPSTHSCYAALRGGDGLDLGSPSMAEMQAWVCMAPPPLVYDAARARKEAAPKQ